MSIRLSLNVNGYRIKADVSIPSGHLRASDMLPVYRQISDTVTNAVIAEEEQSGNKVSCQKGCSACCKRLFVEVTEAEAYRLNDVINTLSERHRVRVNDRFESIRARLVSAGLFDEMLASNSGKANRHKLAADYFGMEIECPFLEQDACSIYHERPLACREYLVTSPASECAKLKLDGVQRVRYPNSSVSYAMNMTRVAQDGFHLIPLALIPTWVERNPEPKKTASGMELLMRAFGGGACNLQSSPPELSGEEGAKLSAPNVQNTGNQIVPDYQLPDALMVPHYGIAPIELLENIAKTAAQSIGVILLTPDPHRTRAFVEQQPDPERFSILVAASDTAWIRDRSPFAVKDEEGHIHWYLPRMPKDSRDADATLFESICSRPSKRSPFLLASGNMVAGPEGVVLSSHQLFEQNSGEGIDRFRSHAQDLGIHRWIVFPPFSEEMTHHADVHVRFLADDLAAIAWNLSSEKDREIADGIASQLQDTLPGMRILRIPIRSDDDRYASTLNWIQLGKDLILPKFDLNTPKDLDDTSKMLQQEGFKPVFIDSPTLETGGSLHCLTASVYL